MQTSLRLRLFLNTLAVLLVGMTLAAVLAWLAVERLYLSTQQENLLAQARLTATALQGAALPIDSTIPYSQTTNALPGIHTRLLTEQGGVAIAFPLPAGQTSVQVPSAESAGSVSPEELLQRTEVRQALQGQAAAAVRRIPSAGRSVLYAAAPINGENGEIIGIVYLAMPMPPAGLPTMVVLQFAGALLLAVGLAIGAGAFLARRITHPLEGFVLAAQSISRGDLGQQLPTGSGISELNRLGEAFNTMTDSLQHSEQARNAFLADVTHELRTPLTVIKGTAETLEDGAIDDPEGRVPLMASMQRETDRLIRMVNDLLVLIRADASALHLDLRPLDLAELARSRCEQLSPQAARRGVNLQVAAGEAGTCLLGDSDRLVQVLDNLLDNAIRHAPEGSAVMVTVRREGEEVLCAVDDRGPGISAEHLPFIFERFYRVDSSRNRNTGGAGLGLAIVRALVLAQGGNIAVRSMEGEGTTITFRLPAADCHQTA
jgi:signal transduction histidine kinase